MSVKITYFVHGTTTDNEQKIATGWNPGVLSELGKEQAVRLGEMVKDTHFDAIFCSDLARSVESAKLGFADRGVPIIEDSRLRECNYGDFNGANARKVEEMEKGFVEKPFPNGESYRKVEARMREFLEHLGEKYAGKHVAIVAHKAPQLALDVILKEKTWARAFDEDWRKKEPKEWRPGWSYES